MVYSWFVCVSIFVCLCIVHTYGTLLESELTYTPLRPDQMDNGALDMSLDEDTSSMDEIPQKCPLKPQKKTKGNTIVLLLLVRTQELSLVLKFQCFTQCHCDLSPYNTLPLNLNHSAEAAGGASLLPYHHP